MLSIDRNGSLLFISRAQLISWLIQNWVYASFTPLSVCQSITDCATPRHDTSTCFFSSVKVPAADLGIPGCMFHESVYHQEFEWPLPQTNYESHHPIPYIIYAEVISLATDMTCYLTLHWIIGWAGICSPLQANFLVCLVSGEGARRR